MIKQAVIDTLEQGIELLTSLTEKQYKHQHNQAFNASIGEHYRHLLEHFTLLLTSYPTGELNYDKRPRNPKIESDLNSAFQFTKNNIEQWQKLTINHYEIPLKIQGKNSIKIKESQEVNSTLGREMSYAIAHAHHHYAIINIMCNLLEQSTNQNFGIAPSTLAHQQEIQEEKKKKNAETNKKSHV